MAGISKSPSGQTKPFIAATDVIGCLNFAKDFVVAGTASTKLYGVAEGLWEPDLEPEDLFETISQTMLNAVDRDAFSGWGVVVHLMWVSIPFTAMIVFQRQLFQHKRQSGDADLEGEDGLNMYIMTFISSTVNPCIDLESIATCMMRLANRAVIAPPSPFPTPRQTSHA